MKKVTLIFVIVALMFATNLFAQRTTDIEGGKDYPLVSRFKGSVIEWYQNNDFDRYFILSLKDNNLTPYEVNGKITRIQYSTGKEHSVFEISKSYENALKNAGFNILVSLDESNCNVNLSEHLYNGEFNGLNKLPRGSIKPDYDGKFSYLAAKKRIENKNIYIVVYTTFWGNPLITFDAIESQAMDDNLVTVKNLDESITVTGHIAIYDIHFDTGKSEIKSESADALQNIAEYLNAHSDKKYIIVGHTDNVGDFEANLKLSKERSEAVKNELVSKYSVKAEQLIAYGDGQTAPVATNSTDEGKAKNRRVEIVEQ